MQSLIGHLIQTRKYATGTYFVQGTILDAGNTWVKIFWPWWAYSTVAELDIKHRLQF